MSPQHRIRLATESDIPKLLDLSNWAAEKTTANFATQPEPLEQWIDSWRRTSAEHPWLVAQTSWGEILGFAKSSPHRQRGAYHWSAEVSVYIAPQHHGQGVGTALYQVLVPLLRAQGYATLLAGIVGGHLPSERLHLKAGFTRCGTFHRIGWKFDSWHDVGYWELFLNTTEPPNKIRSVMDVLPNELRPAVT